MLMLTFFSLLGAIFSFVNASEELIVSTKSGLVKGLTGDRTVGKGKHLYIFRGIPFAEPPVGNLRFEPPVPKKPWKGVLDVSQKKPECLQGSNPVTGSEDCLYLKVYTSAKPNKNDKRPVMVWVYGGAFFAGSPDFDDHSPDYLLDEDVIVASFHYRLGIMGFLSTGDLVAPGNNGLRDQILALKWIKENIVNFGGDPEKITIFGQSAGAASISYLLQTEQTKGLFSQAIIQSGSSLSPWALSKNLPKVVRSIASSLGMESGDSKAIVAHLKSINANELQNISMSAMNSEIMNSNPLGGLVYAPVMEPHHKDAVVTGKSHEMLSHGQFHHIPLIVGYTSLEAMFASLPALARAWLMKYDTNRSLLVPGDMGVSSSSLSSVGKSIKSRYFSIFPIATSGSRLMRFISDDQFERPIQEAVHRYSSRTPVYFYRFAYKGALHGVTNRPADGVGHTEDLGYIFDFGHKGSEHDYQTRAKMVTLWTNFVKYGNPTPTKDPLLDNVQWPANHGGTKPLKCLDVDKKLIVIQSPNSANMEFWHSLYAKYGAPPFGTY